MAFRELYGLFGDPVDHSLSPDIQSVAFGTLAKQSVYLPFRIPPELLAEGFTAARTLGMRGFNITIPHKENAAHLVDALEGDAAAIKAVNVVALRDGKLVGFNTDTLAVTRSLDKLKFQVEGQRALVLGAGGAARAAAYALGKGGAAEVVVANRTFARARELCQHLSGLGIEAVASPASPAALRELLPMSQIVVNATSVGLKAPDESPLPSAVEFDTNAVAIDMVYRPLKTKFLATAKEQGIQTVDGIDILVHQGIGALAIWLNKPVDATRLFPAMRAAALEALL